MPIPLAQPRPQDSTLSGPTRKLFGGNTEGAASWDRSVARGKSLIHAPFPIRIWHLASLDAPTVAIVWCLAFSWTARVRLPWWVLILIPFGVWAIYVADRLLDARRGMHSMNLELLHDRHIFHWRHRRIFAPIAIASAITVAWIVFAVMPRVLREHDSLLAAASLIYFARVHTRSGIFPLVSKEFLVGALFTIGCGVPSWSRMNVAHASSWLTFLIATLSFVLLAWLNCHAIDRWESPDDCVRHSISSIAFLLTTGSAVCAIALSPFEFRISCLLASVSIAAFLLAALDRARSRLTPVTLRAAADLALLTPAVLLLVAPFLHT